YLAGLQANAWLSALVGFFCFFANQDAAVYGLFYRLGWIMLGFSCYNLIPLFRGDLYVVLEEIAGLRNLDKHAYRYVRKAIAQRLFGAENDEAVPPRRALLFVLFCIGSVSMLTFLFYYVLIGWILSGLVETLGFVGFFIWLSIFFVLFGRQLRTVA